MNWKLENPKARYIDELTDQEYEHIAWLSKGKPDIFKVLIIKAKCNDNNIPHVNIYVEYYEPVLGDFMDDSVGIFHNLNVYNGTFHTSYCQKEIFEYFKEIGLE